MRQKQALSLLIALLGEIILVYCFIYFGKNVPRDILILNLGVSTIVYLLLISDLFRPWIDLQDKSQKQIGSIGLRWFFSFVYIGLSIGAMFLLNSTGNEPFFKQLLAHSILFFLLLVGLFLALSSSEKVGQVYYEETEKKNRIEEMRNATKSIILMLEREDNVSPVLVNGLNELLEKLRYISPSNGERAISLERQFINDIEDLNKQILSNMSDLEKIDRCLKSCDSTIKERKKVY